MSESTMRYDPENGIFFHKHEDGSWSAYFCERHESLEEDEVPANAGRFVIRATHERGVGVPSSRSLATATREALSV